MQFHACTFCSLASLFHSKSPRRNVEEIRRKIAGNIHLTIGFAISRNELIEISSSAESVPKDRQPRLHFFSETSLFPYPSSIKSKTKVKLLVHCRVVSSIKGRQFTRSQFFSGRAISLTQIARKTFEVRRESLSLILSKQPTLDCSVFAPENIFSSRKQKTCFCFNFQLHLAVLLWMSDFLNNAKCFFNSILF